MPGHRRPLVGTGGARQCLPLPELGVRQKEVAEGARAETVEGDLESFGDNVMNVVNPGRSIPEGSIARKSGIERQLQQTTRLRQRQRLLPRLSPRPLSKPRLPKQLVLLCGDSLEEREPGWATR